jgi:hypothetical protein
MLRSFLLHIYVYESERPRNLPFAKARNSASSPTTRKAYLSLRMDQRLPPSREVMDLATSLAPPWTIQPTGLHCRLRTTRSSPSSVATRKMGSYAPIGTDRNKAQKA